MHLLPALNLQVRRKIVELNCWNYVADGRTKEISAFPLRLIKQVGSDQRQQLALIADTQLSGDFRRTGIW